MAVLQFAWGSGAANPHLPHNHYENCVVYPGADVCGGCQRAATPRSAVMLLLVFMKGLPLLRQKQWALWEDSVRFCYKQYTWPCLSPCTLHCFRASYMHSNSNLVGCRQGKMLESDSKHTSGRT